MILFYNGYLIDIYKEEDAIVCLVVSPDMRPSGNMLSDKTFTPELTLELLKGEINAYLAESKRESC